MATYVKNPKSSGRGGKSNRNRGTSIPTEDIAYGVDGSFTIALKRNDLIEFVTADGQICHGTFISVDKESGDMTIGLRVAEGWVDVIVADEYTVPTSAITSIIKLYAVYSRDPARRWKRADGPCTTFEFAGDNDTYTRTVGHGELVSLIVHGEKHGKPTRYPNYCAITGIDESTNEVICTRYLSWEDNISINENYRIKISSICSMLRHTLKFLYEGDYKAFVEEREENSRKRRNENRRNNTPASE